MEDFGEIGYILFFVFLIIVNYLAGAAKRKRKQQERQREAARPEEEQPTRSLEDVMRELVGGEPPQRRPQPVTEPQSEPEPKPEVQEEKEEVNVNPLQEYMKRKESEGKSKRSESSAEPILLEDDKLTTRKRKSINLREAVIHSELLMKPRWKEW